MKMHLIRITSAIMISRDDMTTLLVDARPTPCAPWLVVNPKYEDTAPIMNPKTVVLSVGRKKFTQPRLANARTTYKWNEIRDTLNSARYPPSNPEKSMVNVKIGNATTQATTRGTTSNCKGSVERASMSSICSVALISARTAPMAEPARPATSRAVTSGPTSTKKPTDCTAGIMAVAPNITRVLRVCSVITAPKANPDAMTRGNEPAPMSVICRLIWSHSSGGRRKSTTVRTANRVTFPICSITIV